MKLILGTVQFGLDYGINNSLGKPNTEAVASILNKAHELGINELDTADAYGSSTQVLSTYLTTHPQNAFKIMSKFTANENQDFKQSFEASCKNLGVNFLDGYYFHRFEDFKKFKNFDDVRELKANKKLGKLAVSLYSTEDLEIAVNSTDVDLIQLPFNVFDRSDEKIALLKIAKEKNKQIYIRSAFLQGLFFKNLNDLPVKLQPLKSSLSELHLLVNQYQVSMEDLCLGFTVSQNFIDKVVIGVDTVEQLVKNVNSANKKIPAELMNEVLKIKISEPQLLNPVNWNA